MKRIFRTAVMFVAGGLFLTAIGVQAQTTRRVQFARGAVSATVSGKINGYKYIDFIIGIRDNQVLSLDITGGSVEMILFDPDGENVPDAAGIRGITTRMDRAGDYKVRVLMPRAAARRKGSTANFLLKVKIEDMR